MEKPSSLQIHNFLHQAEQRLRRQGLQHRSPDPAKFCQPQGKVKSDSSAGVAHTLRVPLARARDTDQTKDTTGPDWFYLPRTDLTPEFKRDWQLLSMRGLLDPKHQKKVLRSKPPLYCRIGESTSRLNLKSRQRCTRSERNRPQFYQILGEQDVGQVKTKYSKIQRRKSSGKKKSSGG
ncbi:hypothetical protein CDD80_7412 [Ophiocordyceps camponoti-rufipedis]|uniref:Fcf2 pre-rRNA processing C-terminal domain-containing protein n=1 Tax=Ophiocordyceps camponoti-rufipedis TaxID=2004952 RepID=A0A2C5YGD2_9HYPO|nr:hypothetical protein CDD80_7412 [Ophiocordyceps camponoti-rufipedis]